MAKLKVSELTTTTAANPEDLMYIVQSNNSRKITIANLLSTASSNGNSNVKISTAGGPVEVSANQQRWKFNTNGTLTLPILTSAPANVTAGMVAIADGAGWNPANTGVQTVVCYINGGWAKLN